MRKHKKPYTHTQSGPEMAWTLFCLRRHRCGSGTAWLACFVPGTTTQPGSQPARQPSMQTSYPSGSMWGLRAISFLAIPDVKWTANELIIRRSQPIRFCDVAAQHRPSVRLSAHKLATAAMTTTSRHHLSCLWRHNGSRPIRALSDSGARKCVGTQRSSCHARSMEANGRPESKIYHYHCYHYQGRRWFLEAAKRELEPALPTGMAMPTLLFSM